MLRRWADRKSKLSRQNDHDQKPSDQGWTKHPLWIVVNSPIVILVIGAAVIGGIGTIYTAAQKCMSDAEATVQRHAKLMQEIRDRRTDFAQIVVNAGSMSQLKTGNNITNAASRFTYLEFQGRTLRDLEDEEIQLGFKFNIASTPALDLHLEFGHERLQADDMSAAAIWKMIEKQDISSATNKDLPALQAAAQKELGWLFRSQPTGHGVPACGLGIVASRLLTGYPSYIAQFEPWLSR